MIATTKTTRFPDNDSKGAMARPVDAEDAAAIENLRRIGEVAERIDEDRTARRVDRQVFACGTVLCPKCGSALYYTYFNGSVTYAKCQKPGGCMLWHDSK